MKISKSNFEKNFNFFFNYFLNIPYCINSYTSFKITIADTLTIVKKLVKIS